MAYTPKKSQLLIGSLALGVITLGIIITKVPAIGGLFNEIKGLSQQASVLGVTTKTITNPGTTDACDPATSRLYLSGGHNTAMFSDVWAFDPVAQVWTQKTSNAPFGKREYGGMVYFQNKLWIIGGVNQSSTYLNDVWSSSDNGTTWTQQVNAPWSGRIRFGLVVIGNTLYVIGGRTALNPYTSSNEVWAFNGTTWTQQANAPWVDGRDSFATAEHNGKLYISGGSNKNQAFNDTWSFDGATWIQVSSAAPWVKRNLFDGFSLLNKFWVVAGNISTVYKNDTWSFDGASWSQYDSNPTINGIQDGPFPIRNEFNAHVINGLAWIIGGSYTDYSTHTYPRPEYFYNDVWTFDGTIWTQRANAPWTARDGYSSTYACVPKTTATPVVITKGVTVKPITITLSGTTSTTSTVSTTSVTPASTSTVTIRPISSTTGITIKPITLSMEYCPAHTIILAGGHSSELSATNGGNAVPKHYADVWSYNTATNIWNKLATNPPFGARSYGAMAYFKNKIWVFGGVDAVTNAYKNDVWVSSNGGSTWMAQANAPWTGKTRMSTAIYHDKLIMIGGFNAGYSSKEVWSFDGATWTRLPDLPAAINAATATVYNNKIFVVGGYTGYSGGSIAPVLSKNVYIFDGTSWTTSSPLGQGTLLPSPAVVRALGGASVLNNKLWVTGGRTNTYATDPTSNDTWSFDGVHWTQYDANSLLTGVQSGPWGKRNEFNMHSIDGKMWLMFGSYEVGSMATEQFRGDVWSFDGSTWTQQPATNPRPEARDGYMSTACE